MGSTESSEAAKDASRQRGKRAAEKNDQTLDTKQSTSKTKQPARNTGQPVKKNKEGSTFMASVATNRMTAAITTGPDDCTATTVVTRPNGSKIMIPEIIATKDKGVDVKQQRMSPTAVAAAHAVTDFESVSEEKATPSFAELAWHAWSACATMAAMGSKEAAEEMLCALSDSTGVLFTSTVVTPPAGAMMASPDIVKEWKKEDYIKLMPAFLKYVTNHGRRIESLSAVELFILARAFCRFRVIKYEVEENEKSLAERVLAIETRRSKERKVAWELTRAFTLFYPQYPIRSCGLRFRTTNAVLMDKAHIEHEAAFEFISINRCLSKWLKKIIVISLLRDSSEDCTRASSNIVLVNGEVVHCGSWEEVFKHLQDRGVQCSSQKDVFMCLSDKKTNAALVDLENGTTKSVSILKLADELVLSAKSPIVETQAGDEDHFINVNKFCSTQSRPMSSEDKTAVKKGAFMYAVDLSAKREYKRDDEEDFDAGNWLMSWFEHQIDSTPLTTKAAARKLIATWAAVHMGPSAYARVRSKRHLVQLSSVL
ncbi:ATP-BINDING CASSETTE TRANSPORTER [Plasmopara halstedii]|uniref:ATP-BINDING CASSETTE TRANSPORTER n=1 Tax=Plasmopara halstedii TaxID=4781 RepID=A0A0P1B0Y7_PLAHL|nr:ATP-BINDING CASSETTE TRANSPORTER [Plasmopara halstedii]CEG47605.1 ATP-BINDING CASSETTE TRANSPORTER [Plasmopara halstedii]|eukprot:XP_024583974.1 ATP-BINDING CASSETTE TRANSPORTER [Plasmopara halstedii]